MPYPGAPATTGDLVVGNLASRTWLRLNPGTSGQILKVDAVADPDRGLAWTDNLGTKTLVSDLTLLDTGGGAGNLVMRVNLSAETSFVSSHANQQMFFGGHTAGTALGLTTDVTIHEFTASTSRHLQFQLDATKDFIVQNNSTDSFKARAGDVRSLREFRVYDATAAGYGVLTADAAGNGYFFGTQAQQQVYIAGVAGSTSDGLRIRDDGSLWIESTANNKNMNFNVRNTGTFTFYHNYGSLVSLTTGAMTIRVPTTFRVSDSATTTVSDVLSLRHITSGTAAAGFGVAVPFQLENSTGTLTSCGEWAVLWETATAGAEDSAIRMRCLTGGAFTETNLLYASGTNNRIGIKTASPAADLHVVGGNLMVADSTDVGQATFNVIADGSMFVSTNTAGVTPGGIIWLNSTSTATGVRLNTFGAFWAIRHSSTHPSFHHEIGSGGEAVWYVNFAPKMTIDNTDLSVTVPATFAISDATNTVVESLTVSRATSLTPAAGLGAAVTFRIQNAASAATTCGQWATFWETATAGAEDSTTTFEVFDNSSYVELLRLRGSNNCVGIKTAAPTRTLEVTGDAYISSHLELDGDLNHDGTNVGFYTKAPVAQASALTADATHISHTGSGTDYAIATPVEDLGWGFSTQGEFETTMSVVLNLQIRVKELEDALDATSGVGLIV